MWLTKLLVNQWQTDFNFVGHESFKNSLSPSVFCFEAINSLATKLAHIIFSLGNTIVLVDGRSNEETVLKSFVEAGNQLLPIPLDEQANQCNKKFWRQ